MIKKINKIISNRSKYIKFINNLIKMRYYKIFCYTFRNSSFFMQGQMDVNPKSLWYSDSFNSTTGGLYPLGDHDNRKICDLDVWDNTRRDMLILILRTIAEKKICGDIAELGVYKGRTAKLIHYYMPERNLHLFDTFEGFTEKSVQIEKRNTDLKISASHFSDTSLDGVKSYIEQQNNNIFYYKGYFPESIPHDINQLTFAFVHLDADLYEPILEGLKYFYPRMSKKGIIIVHDYNSWIGARKAVDDFFSDKEELPIPMPDKSGSVLIIKQ